MKVGDLVRHYRTEDMGIVCNVEPSARGKGMSDLIEVILINGGRNKSSARLFIMVSEA
jgi:hypothetical protein